jgi:hypothetical protein
MSPPTAAKSRSVRVSPSATIATTAPRNSAVRDNDGTSLPQTRPFGPGSCDQSRPSCLFTSLAHHPSVEDLARASKRDLGRGGEAITELKKN